MQRHGFTLIELLIVVAIIAILALIAVPNFLEAQVRSKAARVKADLRSVATALEAYYVDYNGYAPDGTNFNGVHDWDYWHLNDTLTSPVAYMSNADQMIDPFKTQRAERWNRTYRYKNVNWTWGTQGTRTAKSIYYGVLVSKYCGLWALSSNGPDRRYGPPTTLAPADPTSWRPELGYPDWPLQYDPTNGTVSSGDIERTQLFTEGAAMR